MNELSDRYLVMQLAKGGKDAYNELFARYYSKVRRFLASVLFSEEGVDDLAQNVFLKIWEKRSSLTGIKSLDAYIFAIARNEACDYIRHNAVKKKFVDSAGDIEEYMCDLQISYDTEKIEEIVNKCVASMPQQRQACYKMSREMHLSNQKIADSLNISKRTVDRHISLALKDIKKAIGGVLSGYALFIMSSWM
ncbi:MAG: RNA polymerase sigma-70 factor [Candidatus Cryptobacteroides sp.]